MSENEVEKIYGLITKVSINFGTSPTVLLFNVLTFGSTRTVFVDFANPKAVCTVDGKTVTQSELAGKLFSDRMDVTLYRNVGDQWDVKAEFLTKYSSKSL